MNLELLKHQLFRLFKKVRGLSGGETPPGAEPVPGPHGRGRRDGTDVPRGSFLRTCSSKRLRSFAELQTNDTCLVPNLDNWC